MSRLTSAQVIALGEYLEPTFDPASLTVSQLLGVLTYHNINYPTPYSKPKLAVIFNKEIKANATKLKKERVKKENSIASDEGIVDGATGRPLRKEPVERRASRRLSRAPVEEDTEEPLARTLQPKRRRSSAQPAFGGPSRKSALAAPALVEESEPEDDLPLRKVGRNRKTTETAGAHGRRASKTAAEDSGWEDNNIFQSGAESSSPARPSPVRSKMARKSAGPLKSRKSSSAPPQMLLSTPPRLPNSPNDKRLSPFSPPESTFAPYLPSIPPMEQLRLGQAHSSNFTPSRFLTPVPEPEVRESGDELDIIGASPHIHAPPESIEEEATHEMLEDGPELVNDEDPFADSADAEVEDDVVPEPVRNTGRTIVTNGFLLLVVLFATCAMFAYKTESASIGYCDARSTTNGALERLRAHRIAAEACRSENRTLLYDPDEAGIDLDTTPCPAPPFFPWGPPDNCTLCPKHASCTETSVICDHGFLLRSHPLLFFLPASASPRNTAVSLSSPPADLFWKLVSILDGLPGLGSVALPPRCIEDPKRRRNIGVLGKAIEVVLAQERGRRVCAGGQRVDDLVEDSDGGDAKRWGLELEGLRETMRQKAPYRLLPSFDDTFNVAIQQLTQWGGVIIGEDRENLRYVAHKTPSLTWDCVIKIKTLEAWAEWRATIFGITVILLSLLYGRSRGARRRAESRRVADLVQIALDTLRNQEFAHYTDPVTTPQPYLSSLQLRDSILQDEHSVASRSRLWDQVERVVEGNANVRANLQEIQGGDEMRVWRWVGSAARTTFTPRHVKPDPDVDTVS